MVTKQENKVLSEILQELKKISELLENPKKLIEGEKEPPKYSNPPPYNNKGYGKVGIVLRHPNDPATEKQKDVLVSLNYLGNVEKLTQAEASKLIEEQFAKRNSDNGKMQRSHV